MQRNTQARVAAVTLLLGAMGVGLVRRARSTENSDTPEDAIPAVIHATMNAARAGDVKRYLAAYTGPMRASLERAVEDSGRAAFARYLQGRDAGVKGLAVWVESSGEREARARVEYVYQDRNEVQIVHLEKDRGVWRIARAEGDQPVRAAIPYGTRIR